MTAESRPPGSGIAARPQPAAAAAGGLPMPPPAPTGASPAPAVSTPEIPQPVTGDAAKAIINDPLVKRAVELFGARIVHVEPWKKQ
jgi:hypothetical protein